MIQALTVVLLDGKLKAIKDRIMKVHKETIRKYWKYTDWTQPILTSNGTMGGTTAAASASSIHSSYDGQPWRAFNGQDENSSGWANNNIAPPQWIQFYNPTAFMLTNFTVINRGHCWTAFIVQGSNDGSSFVDIESFTNDNIIVSASWSKTIAVVNRDFYKYYRFYITANSTGTGADVLQIKLYGYGGVEQSTSSDYDYYTDIDVLSTPARVSIHTSNIPKDIVNISATATTTIELNAGNEYYVEIVGGGGRGSYGQAGYWQERYGGGSGSRFSANLSVSSGNHTMVLVCGGGIGSPSTLTIDGVLVATAGGGGTPSAGVVSYDISGVSGIEFSDIVAKNGNGGNRTFDVGGAYTGNAASVASQGQYGQGAGSGNGYGEDYNRRIGWTYLQALKYKITETILYALNK